MLRWSRCAGAAALAFAIVVLREKWRRLAEPQPPVSERSETGGAERGGRKNKIPTE